MDPYTIFIGGAKLENWTNSTLTRTKKGLTGTFNVTIFFGYVPSGPVIRNAYAGQDVNIYVGANLALTGKIDTRSGKIDKNTYTVTINGRGKTKVLVDSSQQHKTGTMLKPTDQQVVNQLVRQFGIGVEWLGKVTKLDKARLRDGMEVAEELSRLAIENAHYMYENRRGILRVCDGPVGSGEALILGSNILTATTSQSEAGANSEIKVKGQHTDKMKRGKEAVDREKVVKDSNVKSYSPLTIQHYGDGTDEALERRGKFEADSRNADNNTVTVEVFHVQSRSGAPWDIGQIHYTEIPPEGIFDGLECTELTYTATFQGELKTSLTLAPPAAGRISGGKAFPSNGISAISDVQSQGRARMIVTGVQLSPDSFPAPWVSASLSIGPVVDVVDTVSAIKTVAEELPPLELPPQFRV